MVESWVIYRGHGDGVSSYISRAFQIDITKGADGIDCDKEAIWNPEENSNPKLIAIKPQDDVSREIKVLNCL